MHPSKSYRTTPEDANLLFADRRGFGTWVVNGDDAVEENSFPLMATAPFFMIPAGCKMDQTDGKREGLPEIKGHLMKSNPLVQKLCSKQGEAVNCTVVISGPDAYVSPDWYEMKDQVPTWNYVTVHLKGQLRLLPEEELYGVLDALSQKFEEAFVEDKPVWKIEKMPPQKLKAMMSVLVPIALQVRSVDGTWKLGQAKPQESRANVAQKMLRYSESKRISAGMELAAFSQLHQVPFSVDCVELLYKSKKEADFGEKVGITSATFLSFITLFSVVFAVFYQHIMM